ncbi:hypothetical protein Micbo1qcDRAFT_166541 [Microdochium bolleyi]|uniref:Uncharacterized protein n=1 Tax=Microdochium bolleyi TaxID=196109 RepID=A0A136IUB1_9PEZI|nr:hypothetical protein Micbo1qcDRAFT_166541 [Microdochium bolleyi]
MLRILGNRAACGPARSRLAPVAAAVIISDAFRGFTASILLQTSDLIESSRKEQCRASRSSTHQNKSSSPHRKRLRHLQLR